MTNYKMGPTKEDQNWYHEIKRRIGLEEYVPSYEEMQRFIYVMDLLKERK